MRVEENRKRSDKHRKIILGVVCGTMVLVTGIATTRLQVVKADKETEAHRINVALNNSEMMTETTTAFTMEGSETTTSNLVYNFVSKGGVGNKVATTVKSATSNVVNYKSTSAPASSYTPVQSLPTGSPTDGFVYNGQYIVLNSSMNDVFSKFGHPQAETITESTTEATTEPMTETEIVTNSEGETEIITHEASTTAVVEEKPVEATTSDVRHLSNITMTKDNTYNYNGFTVVSYKKDGAEYVKSVIVTDSAIKSPLGISFIGNPIFDVTGRYGAPSSLEGNLYTYNVTSNTYMFFICPQGTIQAWGVASK